MSATIHHFPMRTRVSENILRTRYDQAAWCAEHCPTLAADPEFQRFIERKARDAGIDEGAA